MNKLDTIENVFVGVGVAFGIDQIETILGIIILGFQIIVILTKWIIKLVDKIKNKKYEEIPNDTKEAIEELKDLKDKVEDGKEQ